MPGYHRLLFRFAWLSLFNAVFFVSMPVLAGGGLILKSDLCIIKIGFYTAHFTAYQPNTRGNQEFCREFPDPGKIIVVLDYLHNSLKAVPVAFRVIRDVTGKGKFAKWEDVESIKDIDSATVFYHPPATKADASYRVQFDLPEKGNYVAIVSAGHPSKDKIYHAVFPFTVGKSKFPLWLLVMLVTILFVLLLRFAYVSMPAARHSAS